MAISLVIVSHIHVILLLHTSISQSTFDTTVYDKQYKLVDEDAEEEIAGNSAGKAMYTTNCVTTEGEYPSDSVMDTISGCRCHKYKSKRCINCFDPYKCIKFPRDIKMEYNTLRLSTTKINMLHANDLGYKNYDLESFILSENMEFTAIKPGAFKNMTNLKYIALLLNPNLKYLEKNTFQGCDNLEVLKIVRNGFVQFLDITIALHPLIVPKLKLLKLENVKIQNMTRADFDVMAGTNLYALKLTGCEIHILDPKIIIPLRNLTVFYIGENSINQTNYMQFIEEITQSNSNLRSIDLCSYTHLPIQILKKLANSYISRISFSCSTKFFTITEFPKADNIKLLNLRSVSALNISYNAFSNLPNLETLLISQNNFATIPEAALLPNLKNLDISGFSDNEKAKLILTVNKFKKMHNLKYLNLSYNNIARISTKSFLGLANLRVLDLQNSKIVAADNNTFAPLKNLEYLDLQRNEFPGRIVSADIYNGLENLRVLVLTKCGINDIPEQENIFKRMSNLQSLRINDNRINTLHPLTFENLTNLKHIDISSNFLKLWEFRLFSNIKALQSLISQNNAFRTITTAMIADMSELQSLDLSLNKFVCTCDHLKKISSVISIRFLDLLDNHPPLCVFPDDYLNTSISSYMKEINSTTICDQVQTDGQRVSILIGLASSLLVIITSGMILLYIYRWHVKYWLFLAKLAMNGSRGFFKSKFTTKRSYSYDAFVSYCNEDREFVSQMISMLEGQEPYMKLCVYERDFQIGTVISECVLESVAESRRTLLIISDAYIRSQWCRWEVQVAENHRLFFEDDNGKCVNDTLVMVKLGDINTNTIVSPMLKYLMKTRIYLEWDTDIDKQGMFWRKLRRALRPSNKITRLINL